MDNLVYWLVKFARCAILQKSCETCDFSVFSIIECTCTVHSQCTVSQFELCNQMKKTWRVNPVTERRNNEMFGHGFIETKKIEKKKKTCHLQQWKCDFKLPYIWRSLVWIFPNNFPVLRIVSILEVCRPTVQKKMIS